MITRRTPLKRSTKPIKRSPIKRVALPLKRRVAKTSTPKRRKATPQKKLKQKLWELCKQLTRLKYGNTCYTCGKTELVGSNWHTGHFIASSICGLYLRYDLRNLRPQCYRCNINLSSNGSMFYRNMVEREGIEYIEGIFRDKERITKSSIVFYEKLIEEYTLLLVVDNSLTTDTDRYTIRE